MKRSRLIAVSILTIFLMAMLTGVAFTEEITFKGKIKKVDLDTNTVLITDKETGTDIEVIVEDKNAVDQLKAGKIKVGNKAKVKYIKKDTKSIATYLKKLPGC